MTTVTFRVHYATRWGEDLALERRIPAGKGGETRVELLPLEYADGGYWTTSLDVDPVETVLEYRYVFRGRTGEILREPAFRQVEVVGTVQAVFDEHSAILVGPEHHIDEEGDESAEPP